MNETKVISETITGRLKALRTPHIVIDYFDDFHGDNPYSFLSNFYEGEPFLMYDFMFDCYFQTGEHAFQAIKALDGTDKGYEWFNAIRLSSSPSESKALGRSCPLRPDWEVIKFDVMRDVVLSKFANSEKLTQLLLDTGEAYLQEGTLWHDKIWGVELDPNVPWYDRDGKNWLGIILMETRTRLRSLKLEFN